MNKPKVLYVDDEPLNLLLFRANLAKKYDVLTAESGASALEIINNTGDICAVISDMRMPNMSGIEFIRESVKIKPNISYYILSGFDISDEIQEALDSMLIRKYFKKPFNLNELDKEIGCTEQK